MAHLNSPAPIHSWKNIHISGLQRGTRLYLWCTQQFSPEYPVFLEFMASPCWGRLENQLGSTGDDLGQEDTLALYMPQIKVCNLGFAISNPAVLCFISLDSLFVTWVLGQSYLRLQFLKQSKWSKSYRLYNHLYCRREKSKHTSWKSGLRRCQ